MNKKKISRGRLLRNRLAFFINQYVPPYKRNKKTSDKRFAGAYSGNYRAPLKIGYRFRGEK